jgi:hypothetical protein
MIWMEASGFERRPLVILEDHLYHTSEILDALAAARRDLIGALTICSVARSGPDTTRAAGEWLRAHPELQVAACAAADAADAAPDGTGRLRFITDEQLSDSHAFSRLVAGLIRPGGVLVQDVQLSTLAFIPADRWWESIYMAATVRGMFAERPPHVRFLSNKRGYAATFGRELMDTGFDPRGVMEKAALAAVVVPTVAALVDQAFPSELRAFAPPATRRSIRVADEEDERRNLDQTFDVLLWADAENIDLSGQAVREGRGTSRIALRQSQEGETWRALIEDRLSDAGGLPVVDVGIRLTPPGAERAELINVAARHIHSLRSRLTDPGAILTRQHAYRLSDRLSVGIVGPRPAR